MNFNVSQKEETTLILFRSGIPSIAFIWALLMYWYRSLESTIPISPSLRAHCAQSCAYVHEAPASDILWKASYITIFAVINAVKRLINLAFDCPIGSILKVLSTNLCYVTRCNPQHK